jgi:hypothetical protein
MPSHPTAAEKAAHARTVLTTLRGFPGTATQADVARVSKLSPLIVREALYQLLAQGEAQQVNTSTTIMAFRWKAVART